MMLTKNTPFGMLILATTADYYRDLEEGVDCLTQLTSCVIPLHEINPAVGTVRDTTELYIRVFNPINGQTSSVMKHLTPAVLDHINEWVLSKVGKCGEYYRKHIMPTMPELIMSAYMNAESPLNLLYGAPPNALANGGNRKNKLSKCQIHIGKGWLLRGVLVPHDYKESKLVLPKEFTDHTVEVKFYNAIALLKWSTVYNGALTAYTRTPEHILNRMLNPSDVVQPDILASIVESTLAQLMCMSYEKFNCKFLTKDVVETKHHKFEDIKTNTFSKLWEKWEHYKFFFFEG